MPLLPIVERLLQGADRYPKKAFDVRTNAKEARATVKLLDLIEELEAAGFLPEEYADEAVDLLATLRGA